MGGNPWIVRTFAVTQVAIDGTACDANEDYCTPSGLCTCTNGEGAECLADDGDEDTDACNTEPCPIDCIGNWTDFTLCQVRR